MLGTTAEHVIKLAFDIYTTQRGPVYGVGIGTIVLGQ